MERGEVIPGKTTLIEATSGNMGIALAALGKQLGCHVQIIMPKTMTAERKAIIRGYGAELIEVENFEEAVKVRDEMALQECFYSMNQFLNPDNADSHYHGLGTEIVEQAQAVDKKIKAVILGVGTSGTYMGVRKKIKEAFPDVQIFLMEPFESQAFGKGEIGEHCIPGVQDGSLDCLLSQAGGQKLIDGYAPVKSADAREKAIAMMRQGYFNGISSGAYVLAAEAIHKQVEETLADDEIIVTILPDSADRHDFGNSN